MSRLSKDRGSHNVLVLDGGEMPHGWLTGVRLSGVAPLGQCQEQGGAGGFQRGEALRKTRTDSRRLGRTCCASDGTAILTVRPLHDVQRQASNSQPFRPGVQGYHRQTSMLSGGFGLATRARVKAVTVAAIPSMRFADLPRSGFVGWQLSL